MHEIFDTKGLAAGGTLPLSEIEDAWRATGLRRSDLSEALSDTRASGEYRVCGQDDNLVVELTEAGYLQAQRDPQTLPEINELVRAYALLTLVRRRHGRGPNYGRRRADRLDS